jgi:hypothetical protein
MWLRVIVGEHRTSLCVTGSLPVLHLPATASRSSTSLDAQQRCRKRETANELTVAPTAAVIIFWSAALLVDGDKQTAAELSNMKANGVTFRGVAVEHPAQEYQARPAA